MGKKRKSHDSGTFNTPDGKRPRPDASIPVDQGYTYGRIDPVYGQHGAFPGLDDDDGEDGLFYGPASDGLQYLRMVRLEAQGVPNLLKAPASETCSAAKTTRGEDLEDGEYGGEETVKNPHGERYFYEDGNYWRVAPTTRDPRAKQVSDKLMYEEYEEPEEDDTDPQEAYYSSLMARFNAFRIQLSSTPSNIPSSTSPSSLPGYNATYAEWERAILSSSPSMLAVSQMEHRHVLQAIARVEDLLTKKHLLNARKGRVLGAWCWSLLGRCKAMDVMISEEVGIVRGLARRAVGVLRRWGRRGSVGEGVGEGGEESSGSDGSEDAEEVVYGEEGEAEEGEIAEEDELAEEGEADEEGEIVETWEMTNGTSGNFGNAIGSESLHAHNAVPSLPVGQPPISNTRPRGEDPAALELARQKLLEQLSGPAAAEEPPPASLPKPSTSTSEANGPTTTIAPEPSHPRNAACSQEEEPDEGEILSADSSASEDEAQGLAGGSESKRPPADLETAALATLDMIITVVGEFWGQKDLLALREVWGEGD